VVIYDLRDFLVNEDEVGLGILGMLDESNEAIFVHTI
jgi:hypothetical protein